MRSCHVIVIAMTAPAIPPARRVAYAEKNKNTQLASEYKAKLNQLNEQMSNLYGQYGLGPYIPPEKSYFGEWV